MDWSRKVTSISFGYYLAYFASDVLIPVYSNTLFCHPGADHAAFLKGIPNEDALGWIPTFERSYRGHSWDDFIVNVSHEVLNAGYCRMGS